MVAAGGGEEENVGLSREGLHRCREERSLTHGLQSRDVSERATPSTTPAETT
jgi:hypothetical protein